MQHPFPGREMRLRADSKEPLALGAESRPPTRDELVRNFLWGGNLRLEVYHFPYDTPRIQQEPLDELKKYWQKALKKLGGWDPSDWPELKAAGRNAMRGIG